MPICRRRHPSMPVEGGSTIDRRGFLRAAGMYSGTFAVGAAALRHQKNQKIQKNEKGTPGKARRATGTRRPAGASGVHPVTLPSGVSVPVADWVVQENAAPGDARLGGDLSRHAVRLLRPRQRDPGRKGDAVRRRRAVPLSRRALPDGVLRGHGRPAGLDVVGTGRAVAAAARRWRPARTWSSATGSPRSR